MLYDTMDPEEIKALLEGHTDVLTPEAEMEKEIIKRARCPNCGSDGCELTTSPPKIIPSPDGPVVINGPFSNNSPIIRQHALCRACGTEFDYRTGIIIKSEHALIDAPHSGPHQV